MTEIKRERIILVLSCECSDELHAMLFFTFSNICLTLAVGTQPSLTNVMIPAKEDKYISDHQTSDALSEH